MQKLTLASGPRILIFFLALSYIFLPLQSFAAQDYQSQYIYGKDLYKNGKYGAAMEVLIQLTREAQGNNFVEHAHYYYALSGLKSGKLNEAYTMLLQLLQKYPRWENIDEAYYLAANVAFEQKKYRYGMNFLKNISPKIQEDAEALKENFFMTMNPIDSLKAIQKSYPSDNALAKVLFNRLVSAPANEKDKMLSDYLAQEFKLTPTITVRNSEKKSQYNVAVLFPFMMKEMAGDAANRSNSYALELYQGIQKAVDSLKNTVKINLFAYDTEKEGNKINEILAYPELSTMDMIIGPLIPSQNAAVNEFAASRGIITINPLSINSKTAEGNNFLYLFQPTLESQAQEVADYAFNAYPSTVKDTVYIYFSDNVRDSLLATNYRDSIIKRNYNVTVFEKISKDKLFLMSGALSDSTAMSMVNHVFIASTEQIVAANAISALEKTKIVIPVFTRSEWLQLSLISFQQLQKREVHFIFPDFIEFENPAITKMKNGYIRKMHTFPTTYYYTGFELMTFFGKSLFQYGNYFKDGLNSQGFTKGNIFPGFNYSMTPDNNFVPIVKFDGQRLKVVNALKK